MCGIAGILGPQFESILLEQVQTMCDAIVHRGPDDDGFYVGEHIALGMRRLSIIDIQGGRQPISNEDRSIWVVFNGEIYNFHELRKKLAAAGHKFSTASDTEVIVHLYEDYGTRCVERMSGMFGFALWDERRRLLLLARDRLGIKPLYYAEAGGKLFFASELKALLRMPEIERRLDWASVNHLFTFLTTPRSRSIVAGVQKLPPGCVLIARSGEDPEVRRYWDVAHEPDHSLTEESIVERLRALLEKSVREHLVSDVPVGAFLSGGIDSGAVVAMASRVASGRIKTFSVGFDDPSFNELPYARTVAREFGTDHHEVVLQPDALDILDDLVWHLDEPFGDSSAIPTYMVSRLASEHVKVVLSGDGGDELFAGYDKYPHEQRERRYRHVPRLARSLAGAIGRALPDGARGKNFLSHLGLEGTSRILDSSTLFRRYQKQKLFQPDVFDALSRHDAGVDMAADLESRMHMHWLSRLQYLDLKHYLPLDILTKVDTMSMAHSIEARVPLLDHAFVEFAATIPPELMLRNGTGKYIFKRALEGILPGEILRRPKHGFAIPLGRWFQGRLSSFVRDLLLSGSSARRGIFNAGYIEDLIRRNEQGRPLDLQLWTLISFELWCRTFLDRSVGRCTHRRSQETVSASGRSA